MENNDALNRFEAFLRETKIVGDKRFFNKRTCLLTIWPNLLILTATLIFLFLDLTSLAVVFLGILGILWACWYGPALDKSLKETVKLGYWAIIHWFGMPILWLTSGSGFIFTLWPFGKYLMKQILLNLPFGFDNVNTGSAALAVYKNESERQMFEKDPLNYYRLPITINGSIQLFPASIDFFQRIIEPPKWQRILQTTKNEEEVEIFLKKEVVKQIGPEIQSAIAKIIGKKTPAQIIASSEEIEEIINARLCEVSIKWGLEINAFQLAPLGLTAEILDVFNKTVIAKMLVDLKSLEGEAQKAYILKTQMGWVEALEAMREKAGQEMYTIHEQYQTLAKGLEALSDAFKSGNHSLIVGENPVAQLLGAFSPALAGALSRVGPGKH